VGWKRHRSRSRDVESRSHPTARLTRRPARTRFVMGPVVPMIVAALISTTSGSSNQRVIDRAGLEWMSMIA
jgi:hypothetical protein